MFLRKKSKCSTWGFSGPIWKIYFKSREITNSQFFKIAKIEKWPWFGHVWSKGLQILFSSWVFSKWSTFIFWPKNLFTNQTAGGHFVSFAKNACFDFEGPFRGPQTKFFPKNGLKSCVEHFKEKSNLITLTCLLKKLSKFCFKKLWAEYAPPPPGTNRVN